MAGIMEPYTRIRLAKISCLAETDLFISHTILCFHTVTVYCISAALHFLPETSRSNLKLQKSSPSHSEFSQQMKNITADS